MVVQGTLSCTHEPHLPARWHNSVAWSPYTACKICLQYFCMYRRAGGDSPAQRNAYMLVHVIFLVTHLYMTQQMYIQLFYTCAASAAAPVTSVGATCLPNWVLEAVLYLQLHDWVSQHQLFDQLLLYLAFQFAAMRCKGTANALLNCCQPLHAGSAT